MSIPVKVKKVLNIVSKVFTGLVLAFTLLMVVFVIVSITVVGKENSSLFGYKMYAIQTDSMHGTFNAGDIIFVKTLDEDEKTELMPGTIITFISSDPDTYGETITHCIREETTYNDQPAYITYGLATGVDDEYPCLASDVIGTYSGKWSEGGYFYEFMKSPTGYCTCILLPLVCLIGINGYYFIVLLKEYRKEKGTDKKSIADARDKALEENKRLKNEIEELKRVQNKSIEKENDSNGGNENER